MHTGEIHRLDGESWATVVGVVGNVHNYDLVSKPGPDLYIPRTENPSSFARFILNVSGDRALLKNAARMELKTEFPEARVYGFETMPEEMWPLQGHSTRCSQDLMFALLIWAAGQILAGW